MPGAIEERNIIYDTWKILNIYWNKEIRKKISENMMFILYGFSNNNMMDAFTNPSDILISGG